MRMRRPLAAIAMIGVLHVGTASAAMAQAHMAPPSDAVTVAIATYNTTSTRRVTGPLLVERADSVVGHLAVVNGPVHIAGRVLGTLVAINADVQLESGALVTGDLVVVGGVIAGLEGASVRGAVRRQPELLRFHVVGDTLVAAGEAPPDAVWWRRAQRRHMAGRDGRAWRGFSLTSAHTYNRVEGLPILLGPRIHRERAWGEWWLDLFGVVRTGGPMRWDRETLGHDLTAEVKFGKSLGAGMGARLFDVVEGVEDWQMSDGEVGLAAFTLRRDFRDYYMRHGGEGFVKLHAGRDATLAFTYGRERWQSARDRDVLTLLRNDEPWRPNPRMDDGAITLASARLRVDTRRREGSPWGGWYVDATLERGDGRLARDPGLLTVIPRPEGVQYTRGFIDARRYNRLTPDLSVNVRAVAGGWLSGHRLPMERRLSVGGPATLPGYDFRRTPRVSPDVFTCGGASLAGSPALCERVMLLQAEVRGDIHLGWVRNDARDDWWRLGFNRHAAWVVFADAGRGWMVGAPDGSLTSSQRAIPSFSTFHTDIGVGVDFGSAGLYLAKATTTAREPVNVVFRVQHRF